VKAAEKLEIVRKVYDHIAASAACEEGLHSIVQACRKHLGCEAAAFLLLSPKGRALRIKSAVAMSQNFIKTFKVKKDAGAQSEVLMRRRELVLTKGESPSGLVSAFRLENDFKYAVVLPVFVCDRTFGYFQCERNDAPFDNEDLDVLRLFARTAGMLICNWEYCEKIKRIEPIDEELGTLRPNRFFEKFEEELKRSERFGGKSALMFIRFDAYTEYIDYHGLEAGDALIKVLAEVIKESVRSPDFISRYDLESFALCLVEVEPDVAVKVARRIIRSFLHSNVEHREPEIRVSIGMAHTSQAGFDARNVLSCARKALLESQRRGKNRAVIYEKKG